MEWIRTDKMRNEDDETIVTDLILYFTFNKDMRGVSLKEREIDVIK